MCMWLWISEYVGVYECVCVFGGSSTYITLCYVCNSYILSYTRVAISYFIWYICTQILMNVKILILVSTVVWTRMEAISVSAGKDTACPQTCTPVMVSLSTGPHLEILSRGGGTKFKFWKIKNGECIYIIGVCKC